MLQEIHSDSVAQPHGKTGSQNRRTEAKISEDQCQHQEQEEPRSPGPVIGNKGEKAITPRRSPLPIDENLELLVHRIEL